MGWKFLHRLLAVLLIPALLQQAALSAQFPGPSLHPPLLGPGALELGTTPVFTSQALALRPIASIKKAFDPYAAGLVRRLAAPGQAQPPRPAKAANDQVMPGMLPPRSTPLAIPRNSTPGAQWDTLIFELLSGEQGIPEAEIRQQLREVITVKAPEYIMATYLDPIIEIILKDVISTATRGIKAPNNSAAANQFANQFLSDQFEYGILRKNARWETATTKDIKSLKILFHWLLKLIGNEFEKAGERLDSWRAANGPREARNDAEWNKQVYDNAALEGREAAKKYLVKHNRHRMPDLPNPSESAVDMAAIGEKELQVLEEVFQFVQSRAGTLEQIREMNLGEFARRLGAREVTGDYAIFHEAPVIGVSHSAWKIIQEVRAGIRPLETIPHFDEISLFVDGPGLYYSPSNPDIHRLKRNAGIIHLLMELRVQENDLVMDQFQQWAGYSNPLVLETQLRLAHLLGGDEIAETTAAIANSLASLNEFLNRASNVSDQRTIELCMLAVNETYKDSLRSDYRDESMKLWQEAAQRGGEEPGAGGSRTTLPIRADRFGNPGAALPIPTCADVIEFLHHKDEIHARLSVDRLYYDLSNDSVLWAMEAFGSEVTLEPGLTLKDLAEDQLATYVIGRMRPGGPFVVRRQARALRLWDYDGDPGYVIPLRRPSALSMSQEDKALIREALHTALRTLGYTEKEFRDQLARKRWTLRFERRSLHDFKAERDLDSATIILHDSLLDHGKTMGLALAMTDEIRHIMTGDDDAANTAPALCAYMIREGTNNLAQALEDLRASSDILTLYASLVSNMHYTGTEVSIKLADALLKERGEIPRDGQGRPRQTLPVREANFKARSGRRGTMIAGLAGMILVTVLAMILHPAHKHPELFPIVHAIALFPWLQSALTASEILLFSGLLGRESLLETLRFRWEKRTGLLLMGSLFMLDIASHVFHGTFLFVHQLPLAGRALAGFIIYLSAKNLKEAWDDPAPLAEYDKFPAYLKDVSTSFRTGDWNQLLHLLTHEPGHALLRRWWIDDERWHGAIYAAQWGILTLLVQGLAHLPLIGTVLTTQGLAVGLLPSSHGHAVIPLEAA